MMQDPQRLLRVLMIGPYPRTPDRINGGVAAALMYLSEALVASGKMELIGVRIAKDETDICDRSKFNWVIRDLSLGRFSLSTLYRRQQRSLRALIHEFRPDIVHAQGTDIAGYIAIRSGLPTVVTVHGLLAECAKFQTDPLSRLRATVAAALTERGTIRRSRHLIAISPYVTRYYGSDAAGVVHDVPNAVSDAYFGVTPRPQPGRFLYAGRIANGKGLVELLEAFAKCAEPHWTLVLAGATPESNYGQVLERRVRSLGVAEQVRFAGLLDERSLIQEFASAQALVLPSHQETAPMVIQQAMAAALPVIATNVGGIPFQLTHDESGLIFDVGDVTQLAALLQKVSRQPVWASSVGLKAKSEALRRFHSVAVATATLSVYQDMSDSGPTGDSTRRTVS